MTIDSFGAIAYGPVGDLISPSELMFHEQLTRLRHAFHAIPTGQEYSIALFCLPLLSAAPHCLCYICLWQSVDCRFATRERKMNKRFGAIAVFVILAASIIGGMQSRARRAQRASSKQGAIATASTADNIENDYSEAVTTVSNNYAGDIDYEKATQAAIQGMLFTLDPHSVYFPYSEFKKLKEDQDSRFYGIGVTILQHRDGVYVQSTVEGTPAARAGLKYGDRMGEVDGKDG